MYYNMYIHSDLPKSLRWDPVKSEFLKHARGASFDEVLTGPLLAIHLHETKSHQKKLIVFYKEDVWVIPFVEEDKYFFLKTMYRSRKHRKRFIKENKP